MKALIAKWDMHPIDSVTDIFVVSVYLYLYVCVYVCTYICMTYTQSTLSPTACDEFIFVCMYVCRYVCMHVCVYEDDSIVRMAYIHTCMHAYIHTYAQVTSNLVQDQDDFMVRMAKFALEAIDITFEVGFCMCVYI